MNNKHGHWDSLQYSNIWQMKDMRILRNIIAFIFFCLFFMFSLSSIIAYYNGDILQNVFFDYENDLIPFPSLTLCPSLEINNLVNLKLNEIQKDFNISFKNLDSFMIYRTLRGTKNLTSMVEKYSFSLNEMVNIRRENRQHRNGSVRVDFNRIM